MAFIHTDFQVPGRSEPPVEIGQQMQVGRVVARFRRVASGRGAHLVRRHQTPVQSTGTISSVMSYCSR